jgi:tRNA uridine 5-carbamoylmethylation protein Kti12
MIKKTVIINRAVPGSGKTTITNVIVSNLKSKGIPVSIHSTDEYFMLDNKYIFELEKLGKYHDENLKKFKNSINNGTDVVICDNTNIAPWQTEPYSKLAREYGYQILFITLDPRELEKHVASQQVTEEKPDAHGVSKEVLERMIEEYYVYDDLLNSRIVIDEKKHIHYSWDNKNYQKVNIGIAKHFDSDFVIRILPNEYQEVQSTIGEKILSLLEI